MELVRRSFTLKMAAHLAEQSAQFAAAGVHLTKARTEVMDLTAAAGLKLAAELNRTASLVQEQQAAFLAKLDLPLSSIARRVGARLLSLELDLPCGEDLQNVELTRSALRPFSGASGELPMSPRDCRRRLASW